MNIWIVIDTETTGLKEHHKPWELAAKAVNPETLETINDYHTFINLTIDDYQNIDLPPSFKTDLDKRYTKPVASENTSPLLRFSIWLRQLDREDQPNERHIFGVNPTFDIQQLKKVDNLFESRVHYRSWDITTLAAAHLNLKPPVRSETVSKALGVDPENFERHTAMGDVDWGIAQLKAIYGGQP